MAGSGEKHEFFCPHCRASNLFGVDPAEGNHQSLTFSCSGCHLPVTVDVEIDWEGAISYDVEQEE